MDVYHANTFISRHVFMLISMYEYLLLLLNCEHWESQSVFGYVYEYI